MTEAEHLADLAARLRRRMVAGQIRDEMTLAILGPVADLLGADAADTLSDAADARAGDLADQLLGQDRAAAYEAAEALRPLIPRVAGPWWRTSLGQAIAAAGVTATSEIVTTDQAARLLGLSRRRVAKLIRTGRLATSTDGQPLLAAVLDRWLTCH